MMKDAITWSRKEYKDLPWRKNRSLYGTLVSEIMLQQTTVGTVINHFDRFLNVYPDVQTLAKATEEEVCLNWQGLGYYRRARNLRKAAIAIVENHGGEFPKSLEELKAIPGIGDYTANAILAIGMNTKALAIDANLERVISRLLKLKEMKGPKLQKDIASRFEAGELDWFFKSTHARDVNEMLMDVGRVYCQARKADCFLCPLRENCQVAQSKESPLSFPVVGEDKKKQAPIELEVLRVVVKRGKSVYAYTKGDEEWLAGQIEIPTFILSCEDKKLKQYPRLKLSAPLKKQFEELPSIKTAITKYKITNRIYECSLNDFKALTSSLKQTTKYNFFNFNSQDHHPSTTTLKVLKKINFLS